MKPNDIIRDSIHSSVYLMQRMTDGMTVEQLHWNPPGTAHSVAATYAHAALATDWQIHALFSGGLPRFETDWAGKTGISKPQVIQTLEWAQTVRLDLLAFQAYAADIFNETLIYCANLREEDFSRTIDLSVIGAGERPLSWCMAVVVVGHLHQLVGEIAAVKGAQGLQGYPT